jgi:hypothetical protein
MKKHSHTFVESYDGLVGFGLDRATDEHTVRYYLQKFSDDAVTERVVPKMTDQELASVFDLLTRLLRNHLSEPEYHAVFLKDSE